MLPRPFDDQQQQYYGRTYLNPAQAGGRPSSFNNSAGPPPEYPSHGEDEVEWQGSTRRSSEGGTGTGGEGEDPLGAGGGEQDRTAAPPLKKLSSTVNRSAMACMLCRKQKMKCEGQQKAPCRRCRAANVECIFEPAVPAPQGNRKTGTATKEWIETRMAGVEGRLKNLETKRTSVSSSSSTTDPSSPVGIPSPTEALEVRIAQLEAQVYALAMANQHSNAPPSAFAPHPQQQQQQYSHPYPGPGGPIAAYPPHPQPTRFSLAPSSASSSYPTFYPTPELEYQHSPPPPPPTSAPPSAGGSAGFYNLNRAGYPPQPTPLGGVGGYSGHGMEQRQGQGWGEEGRPGSGRGGEGR